VLAVKLWAKQHGINEARLQTLSSYTLRQPVALSSPTIIGGFSLFFLFSILFGIALHVSSSVGDPVRSGPFCTYIYQVIVSKKMFLTNFLKNCHDIDTM
jgi:hypothetical protein